MAGLEAQLSREVTRVTSCPYPASLAKLADILALVSADTVQKCVADRPLCEVSSLAAVVTAALPLWPYSLPMLQNLCHSQVFRDSLILQHPGILNTLLARANGSQREFDQYAGTCVLLLSRPLPDAVQLPEAALRFFLSMFENAVRRPSVQTLRPVYSMLNGACQGLVNIVPVNDRHRFDNELCQVLSSQSSGQDSMLLLWCIGIVLLLEHSQNSIGSFNAPHDSSQKVQTPAHLRNWSTAAGRRLFGSPKSLHKTISLTFLNVIWATRGDGMSDAEALEGIAIATLVLQLVDNETRQQWPTSSDLAKGSFPKLNSKIFRSGISSTVQLQAMAYYAIIVGESRIQSKIATQYDEILLKVTALSMEPDILQETLHVSLPLFAEHLSTSTLQGLLLGLLDTGAITRKLQASSNLIVLVKELVLMLPVCEALQGRLSFALSAPEVQRSLEAFLSSSAHFELSSAKSLHNTVTASESRALVSHTLTLLLTIALTAGGTALPQHLVISILAKQHHMTLANNFPVHIDIRRPQQTISLFQQECTPATGINTTDWRDNLKSELDLQSSYQRDSLIRSVAQICQSLETRCENVEEPLRCEQDKVKALEEQLAQSDSQITALQSQTTEQKLYIDGLLAENSSINDEMEELSARLQDLTAQFDSATSEADETLRAAQDQFRDKELELRSLIVGHEESLLAQARELKKFHNELDLARNELQEIKNHNAELSDQNDTLKAKTNEQERELESERDNGTHHAEELLGLRSDIADLESRLGSTTSDFQKASKELLELQRLHQDLQESSAETLREVEAKHQANMEAKATEYDSLSEELRAALEGLDRSKQAHENARQELHVSQKAVGALKAKVRDVTAACDKKDVELDELRAIKHNIITMMGVSDPTTPRTGPAIHTEKAAPCTPETQHRRRKSALPNEDPARNVVGTQGISGTAMECLANASFSSTESSRNGPTPKRAKPRPTFKIPVMHAPKAATSAKPRARRSSPTKRSALKVMSPNRRHTTVGVAMAGEEDGDENCGLKKRRESLDVAEQTSFDMSMLAGTPLTPGNFISGTGRGLVDDEETTEL